jgi:hypothetical protein
MAHLQVPPSFEEEIRPELTLALLRRADQAGEVMRSLIFAGAGAAIGFMLQQLPKTDPYPLRHAFPIVVCLSAAAAAFYSWAFQKQKARERYVKLLVDGVKDYINLVNTDPSHYRSNLTADLFAGFLLGAGVLSEILFRLYPP